MIVGLVLGFMVGVSSVLVGVLFILWKYVLCDPSSVVQRVARLKFGENSTSGSNAVSTLLDAPTPAGGETAQWYEEKRWSKRGKEREREDDSS